MTTYPLPTLACTVGATGISSPSYNDIYASLQASFQGIYGSDAVIDPSSQDGQMLAIFAQAQYDSNQATIAAYNNFSPATAQGAGLSSVVKINGLRRESASNSTQAVSVVGQAGTTIIGGAFTDANGNAWSLPPVVLIPSGGSLTETATAQAAGSLVCAAPLTIATPTLGWQSVTVSGNTSRGAGVETDAALRARQSASTSLPAQTPVQAIYANLANLSGVTALRIYENDGAVADGNGVPGHSICVVIAGGSVAAIAQTIEEKKAPGCGTYGTTSELVLDPAGVPITINFDVLSYLQIYVAATITPGSGYTSTIGSYIVAALAQAVNSFGIGANVQYSKLWAPANLSGSAAIAAVSAILGSTVTQAQLDAMGATYEVTALAIGTAPAPTGTTDVAVPFNEQAQTQTSQVTLTT